ncbi:MULTISPECIES: 6-pyruvoyl tetrahydropterin synthase family protein [unclassified Haloferax]|uniref:6-pyruvoyl trahydropterin synthase family protein n=1 Tax=unclassified Haloferax TaxID=2625095 RepID=UPI00287427A1|nr:MULTISPECIES: 6-pyruvoyl tetrahydropterin synthase family protein [unclassified Haloferax]MDS0243577.1 6-pyruvoyl tetrahydropterin synthase family protein [Haloferax sp. S2CR25]MDS0446698.1 6-pyruvoyl tetrahydropterin synthase family protein [Haloferax sp. S2CR25-2]
MTRRISEESESSRTTLSDAGERTLHIGQDRPIRISSGHRLIHHEGKCSRPHGHNYEISVTVTGTLTEEGWLVDKADITSTIDEWDHRFLLEKGDPLIDAFTQSGDGDAVVVLDHPPTVEVMAVVLENRLLESLPDDISDVSIEIAETNELCAE